MNKHADAIIEKLIGILFPEISKKIAWTLIATGLAIIVVPNPVYVIAINYLVDIYNVKFSGGVNFIKINNTGPSAGVGLIVVIIGTIYSLANNYLPIFTANLREEIERRKLEADTQLYHKFLKAFPPESETLRLLKEHNFGNSFHQNSIDNMDDFNDSWHISTNHFSNGKLEVKLKTLVDILKELNEKLAYRAHYINGGQILSIVPDAQRLADDFSQDTHDKIMEVNGLASSAVTAYDELIASCKEELGV